MYIFSFKMIVFGIWSVWSSCQTTNKILLDSGKI